jgi:UDP-N-acetylmuramate--alanine ligase
MHYHIVGIAGAGMSAVATMLLDQGHTVSGSDLQENTLTAALMARGALINRGHDPSFVTGADALIATSAVHPDHPELVAARMCGIPLLKRPDVWKSWSQERSIIAVAGTHGKTTTTAMISFVCIHAGLEVGFLIGSEVPQLGTNARWGNPLAPLIIEADEYDYAFLGLQPDIAVITTIEWDHPDIFPSETTYMAAFAQFIQKVNNVVLLSEQIPFAMENISGGPHVVHYGFETQNEYRAIASEDQPETWNVATPSSSCSAMLKLAIPGRHNVRNALATLSVVDLLGLNIEDAAQNLAHFQGTARRFEFKGERDGVLVIDDYAHHPTEVAATLSAARSRYPESRIVAYVQPHTFSRTEALIEQWATAMNDADMVFIGDVYASREAGRIASSDVPHLDPREELARELVKKIGKVHRYVFYAGTIEEAIASLVIVLRSGDVLITMGAGDGFRVGEGILQASSYILQPQFNTTEA